MCMRDDRITVTVAKCLYVIVELSCMQLYVCLCHFTDTVSLFYLCRHAGVLKSRQCDMYVCV